MSSRDFCLKLLHEYNVLVVPGTAFGNSGEGYIRISYAASQEKLEVLIAALSKRYLKLLCLSCSSLSVDTLT